MTKGAYFHHFETKEALGVAAAEFWSETTGDFFDMAPYHAHDDPLDRVLAYITFRKSLILGDMAEFTCLVGTMTQEAYASHPAIREACASSILDHAATLEPDIIAATKARDMEPDWTAESLSRHIQAVIQGAFIMAKATGDREQAKSSLDHLARYIELLFEPNT